MALSAAGRVMAGGVLFGALAVAGETDAQDDFGHTGPYLGLGMTGAVFENDHADGGVGGNLHIGWRVHPRVALEAYGEYIPDTHDIKWVWGGFGQARVFVLTGRIQPFVQGGIGAMGSKAQNVDFAGRVGGGVDVYVTENILASFDFARNFPDGREIRKLEYWSLGFGAQYRF